MIVATGCGQESEGPDMTALQPTIEAARQDPEATVRLAQDLFMQKQFAATEMLFTPKFVSGLTDNGKRSYGEIQRKQAELVGGLTRYEILGVRIESPMQAEVDIDSYWGGSPSKETLILIKGSDGWQIDGSLPRNIAP
jgi:hypothetical protein